MTSTSSHLHPAPSIAPGEGRIRPNRLTLAAGISLLVISAAHTLVFAFHSWWGPWLAGPLRAEPLPVEAAVQFWALPGGFVVPGALLALLVLVEGRRGRTVHPAVGPVLLAWALACIWIVGPSGFLTLLVPATLLIIASVRGRRGGGGVGRISIRTLRVLLDERAMRARLDERRDDERGG